MVCGSQLKPALVLSSATMSLKPPRESTDLNRLLFPCAVSMHMSTHILVRCPICRCSLNVRRVYIGKTVACRYCDQAFVIRLGEEPVTVQLPDPTGRPHEAPEADPALSPPWSGASDDSPSLVIDVRGAWDPDADRSLEVTRTAQDPSWPEVEVVQVDLGCPSPAVVTLFAAELERLRGER